jgi:hypothetical protein
MRIAALVLATLALVACAGTKKHVAHRAAFVRTCEQSVRGELGRDWRSASLNVGPISFLGLPGWASAPASELGVSPQKKVLVVVRGGARVTVAVTSRRHAALLYDPRAFDSAKHVADGERAVRFVACEEQTQFNGAFLVDGRRCVPIEIRWDARRERRVASFGEGGACA